MPLVGVIRGERIPDAPVVMQTPVMVRTPVLRVPLWAMVCWWCLKGLTLLVLLACRCWFLTGPGLVLAGLWFRYGWTGLVTPFAVLALDR